MTELRAAKIKAIEEDIDPLEWRGDEDASVLVVGWGGTYGAIGAACRSLRLAGKKIAHAHIRHLFPFPRNTEEVLRRFDKVIVPELNMGQLSKLIRAEFLIDVQSINKMQGQPFRSNELEQMILERM
jgi:2-oxoglutarate ferredoxin oxidoreductase subunit alpha